MARIDLGDFSVPLTFDAIEPGDFVACTATGFVGKVVRVGQFHGHDAVAVHDAHNRLGIIYRGEIRVLGYAGAPTL